MFFPHFFLCAGTAADGSAVNGSAVNGSDAAEGCYPSMPVCLPCWPGCRSCQDGSPCRVQESWLLRASVLAVQSVCMVLILVSMLLAYRHRRNRVSWFSRAHLIHSFISSLTFSDDWLCDWHKYLKFSDVRQFSLLSRD